MRTTFILSVLLLWWPGVHGPARAAERAPFNTEPSPTLPLTAQEAAQQWKWPEGFTPTVFAAEPDVQQPIAMAVDHRGRLWVAECYTYAEHSVGW